MNSDRASEKKVQVTGSSETVGRSKESMAAESFFALDVAKEVGFCHACRGPSVTVLF